MNEEAINAILKTFSETYKDIPGSDLQGPIAALEIRLLYNLLKVTIKNQTTITLGES